MKHLRIEPQAAIWKKGQPRLGPGGSDPSTYTVQARGARVSGAVKVKGDRWSAERSRKVRTLDTDGSLAKLRAMRRAGAI